MPEVFKEFARKNQKKSRIIIHHEKANSHTFAQTKKIWKAKTSNWCGIYREALIFHPMTFFLIPTHKKMNYVDYNFRQPKTSSNKSKLMHSRCIFRVTSIEIETVRRRLIQTLAKVNWFSWKIVWKTINSFSMKFFCFSSKSKKERLEIQIATSVYQQICDQ